MTQLSHLLDRLTRTLAAKDPTEALSSRLCHSFREMTNSDAAAITVHYQAPSRVTLCATDEVATRLEDLQDVLGEGPGHSASASGQIEICIVPATASSRWSVFVEAAQDMVDDVLIHAIPMHPEGHTFGVITLYTSPQRDEPLRLERHELQFLANVVGAALVGDSNEQGESLSGPWASRAQIHQATGMVVAQTHLPPDDALALLRAHAYAQQSTLSDIASDVVTRRIRFPVQ